MLKSHTLQIASHSFRQLFLGWLACMGLGPAVGYGQAIASQSEAPRYELRQVHDRDGIGKFYMGREIAHVMGHQAADWLERPERDDEEKPDQMIQLLELKPGMNVADIGAGTGYISWRMAQ